MSGQVYNTPGVSLVLTLPAKNGKPLLYHFRLIYRDTRPDTLGCVATWRVSGGSQLYQVDLEAAESGELVWHCSCQDQVYRGDRNPFHTCRHIRGVRDYARVLL